MAKPTGVFGGYPTEQKKVEKPKRVSFTVRLDLEPSADLKFISDLWNVFDGLRGQHGPKWKPSSVIARMLKGDVEAFWGGLGGRPKTEDQRRAVFDAAVERFKKAMK